MEQIRNAARAEKRQLAEQRRQQILKEMGLNRTGNKIVAGVVPGKYEKKESNNHFKIP